MSDPFDTEPPADTGANCSEESRRLVLRNAPMAALATLVLSLSLAFFADLQVAAAGLTSTIWVLAMVTVAAAGAVAGWFGQRLEQPGPAWYYAMLLQAFAIGSGWAIAAWLFGAAEILPGYAVIITGAALGGLFRARLPTVMAGLIVPALGTLTYLCWAEDSPLSAIVAIVLALGLATHSLILRRALKRSVDRWGANLELVSSVSAQKEELERLNRSLSEQMAQRQQAQAEVDDARRAAEAAAMSKGEFLATMSHEIRTPLNGIIPLLDILRGTDLDEEQADYLETAYESSRHLLSIIDDILDYSKIEAGKLELEQTSINVKEIIDQVVRLMSRNAEAKGLRLRTDVDNRVRLALRGDPVRLKQVLTNLLSNAIKFTQRGHVMLSVSQRNATRSHVELLFTVRDTGIGMDEETMERLFTPFEQADSSTTRHYGGTGLGLVICRRILDLMGGEIGVRSQKNKGSVFWFSVPLMRAVGDISEGRKDLSGSRFMVLSAEDSIYENIARQLSAQSASHLRGGAAPQVLEKLRSTGGSQFAFDGVVANLESSARATVAVVRGLARESMLQGLAVVGVGGDGATRRELASLGVEQMISLPIKQPEFKRALETAIGIHEALAPVADSELPELEEAPAEDPVVITTTVTDQAQAAGTGPLRGHALLVEDNPVNQHVARKLVKVLGLSVELANNGQEAVDKFTEGEFDVVLMDCQMPVMDGYTATGAMRKFEQDSQREATPIIAMTANAMAGDRQKCLDAGMDDYLSKPLNKGLLEQALGKWLESSGAPPAQSAPDATPGKARTDPVRSGQPRAIDHSVIEDLIDIMGDEFRELLDAYLADAPKLLRQMAAAAKSDRLDDMLTPAHSLKSTSANMGAIRLSEMAKALELSARRGSLAKAVKKVALTHREFQRAKKELMRIRDMSG